MLKFLIILISGVILWFTGCSVGQGKKTEPPLFLGDVFSDKEVYKYALVTNSDEKKVGESIIAIEKLENGDFKVIESASKSEVVIDSKTLKSKSSHVIIETPDGVYDITTTFADRKVSLVAQTPKGEQKASVKIPSNTYHNNALLMILRGMDFTKEKVEFHIYIPSNSTTIKTNIKVIGEEKVAVPAGEFETYHIKIICGPVNQDIWYEKLGSHRMIKYDNGSLQYRLESMEE